MNNTERISNYEIMKRQMQQKFSTYDHIEMIKKFNLHYDRDYIYINFLCRRYRINRFSGEGSWSENDFSDFYEAGFEEAMTIFDVLCYSKPYCHQSGEYINMKSLSSIKGGSSAVGTGLFQKTEKIFDHNDGALVKACLKLNGEAYGKGDVAYRIPIFDFLTFVFQFWNSDDEFPASLQIYPDKNILDYMHYETVWYAASHLLTRIKEEIYR